MGDIRPNEHGNLDLTTGAQQRLNVSVSIDIDAIVQAHLEHLPCLPIERKIDMLESLLDEIRKWQSPPTLAQLVEHAQGDSTVTWSGDVPSGTSAKVE